MGVRKMEQHEKMRTRILKTIALYAGIACAVGVAYLVLFMR